MAWLAMPMRPASSTPIAILKPWPRRPAPRRLHHVIGELDLAGGGGADAQLRFGLAAMKPARVGVDHERGDPARPLSGSVIANSTMYFCHRAGGDPALLPLTTKLPSACFTALQRIAVASEPDCGFGQRERADLAAFRDRAHVLLFLRPVPKVRDAAEQRVVHRDDGAVGGVGAAISTIAST